jgi:hypothetical protein
MGRGDFVVFVLARVTASLILLLGVSGPSGSRDSGGSVRGVSKTRYFTIDGVAQIGCSHSSEGQANGRLK